MDRHRQALERRLAAELDASVPPDWQVIHLEMRVEREAAGRIRLRQQLVSDEGELAKGPDTLLEVVRDLIEHLRRRDELFAFARYSLDRAVRPRALRREIDPDGCEGTPDVTGYAELLSRNLVLAQARQKRLVDVIGGLGWEVDLRIGKLAFAPDGPRLDVQFLATSRPDPDRWLWGHTDPPPHAASLFVDVLHIRSYGEEHGLFPLTHAMLPLDAFGGHATAGLAAVLAGATAYFRCQQQDAAIWLLVRDAAIDALPVATYRNLRDAVMVTKRAGVPDQAASLVYALEVLRVPFAWEGDLLRADLPGGGRLAARYDASRNTLRDLSGTSGGASSRPATR